MHEIDRSRPILVTGGTGYLASWIIKKLLEKGIDVHATVRDPSDSIMLNHFDVMTNTLPGKLKLFQANLLDIGSFDEAMHDCELVIHTASPFFLTGIKNPEDELIRPARDGVKNVLESANCNPTVKRIVLTSSVAAIYGDNADIQLTETGTFTEKDWNVTSNAIHQPYAYSKTIAEKEAWSMAEKQDQWDLVVINPGWILGPSLTKRKDSMSIDFMLQLGIGAFKTGVPAFTTAIVDIRDVATAHINAGFTPEASGRHIVVSGVETLLGISNILRKSFGDKYPFPRRQVPKFVFWLIAPMLGYTRQYVSQNVGIPLNIDNSNSIKDLDMSYIPYEQTIKEHFQQILDDGLLIKL